MPSCDPKKIAGAEAITRIAGTACEARLTHGNDSGNGDPGFRQCCTQKDTTTIHQNPWGTTMEFMDVSRQKMTTRPTKASDWNDWNYLGGRTCATRERIENIRRLLVFLKRAPHPQRIHYETYLAQGSMRRRRRENCGGWLAKIASAVADRKP